jgi:hypothetical protein
VPAPPRAKAAPAPAPFFSPSAFDAVTYGATVSLETCDGWFLSVHPKTGAVSVREPEARWQQRRAPPFSSKQRPPPICAFRVAHLTDPSKRGEVRFGDPVWLVVVGSGSGGNGGGGGDGGAAAPPPWREGSVLCSVVQRADALASVSAAVAAAALGGWDERSGTHRVAGALPARAADNVDNGGGGGAPSPLVALRAFLEARERAPPAPAAARAASRAAFSPLDPIDITGAKSGSRRNLAVLVEELAAAAAAGGRSRGHLLDSCGDHMGVLRPGAACVPLQRGGAGGDGGAAAAAAAASARNRVPAETGRWGLLCAARGSGAKGAAVKNGDVVVLTQGLFFVTSASARGAISARAAAAAAESEGEEGGGGGGAPSPGSGSGGPKASPPPAAADGGPLCAAQAALDSSVFVGQPGDGCAGGNRRAAVLAALALDVGEGAGAAAAPLQPGARAQFALRLLSAAPPPGGAAAGARSAAPAPQPLLNPAAEARLEAARRLRLGAAGAARAREAGAREAPDPADAAACENIPHMLASSRAADRAAATERQCARRTAQGGLAEQQLARERLAPGVQREAAAARGVARAALKRAARRHGLPLGGAGQRAAAAAAPLAGGARAPPPTPPPRSCALCGAHYFCSADLCGEARAVGGAVALGAPPPPRSPLARRGGAPRAARGMDWGVSPRPSRPAGDELAVVEFHGRLSAQDAALGLEGTMREARAITRALLRAADAV